MQREAERQGDPMAGRYRNATYRQYLPQELLDELRAISHDARAHAADRACGVVPVSQLAEYLLPNVYGLAKDTNTDAALRHRIFESLAHYDLLDPATEKGNAEGGGRVIFNIPQGIRGMQHVTGEILPSASRRRDNVIELPPHLELFKFAFAFGKPGFVHARADIKKAYAVARRKIKHGRVG
ncbi:hypothetical protein EHZ19_09285 [Paraburkholderia bannensis]|nr:hypothetical protein [Paraburkholderia bannensis]RQM48414.1 hypothetical protein EHZ19_09285 [Paraburkholderia bannensis]